jgi:hypothetical protein
MIERTIKTIKQLLTLYVNEKHSNWDEFLQPSISAYNTSNHSALKMSPYGVLFAKEPIILAEVMLSSPKVQNEKELDVYVKDLKSYAGLINYKVNTNLNNSH